LKYSLLNISRYVVVHTAICHVLETVIIESIPPFFIRSTALGAATKTSKTWLSESLTDGDRLSLAVSLGSLG
jgi:hypothetical protein